MSKRNLYWVSGAIAAIALALFIRSFTVRAITAGLALSIAVAILIKASRAKASATEFEAHDVEGTADDSSPETFALGKMFEATMSGMREGLLVVDQDMRVVASNAAAHNLFNLSRGKLNTQRLTELTRNPVVYSAFLDALQGTERSGVRIQTNGPERLVFDLRVVPLGKATGGNSTHQGALGVFIDVTRIERLEQIRQEFLSNVSHELRTPLTAILAFVETLENNQPDDKESSARFLGIIRRNAMRMEDLIDDILELSAIEAGNVQVSARPVSLHPLVDHVIASLAANDSGREIQVTNAVDRDATVFADARRLEQMLTNLIDNAIKFNRAGGQVTIKHQRDSLVRKGGDRLGRRSAAVGPTDKIIVEDTGEGIPAQHLERLFERFYRVDRARSRELGGTGLGLAIVKHLARAHGGEVTVTSELGKGSTFTIELPHYEAPGTNS
jgi:two-component system phosphate regulon sensor histidine kinase PhoR